jgi:hypothetical protein
MKTDGDRQNVIYYATLFTMCKKDYSLSENDNTFGINVAILKIA